mmetsp:Transcript_9473/g.20867  ORF Transcript_9473/g.20867 Transcript_9473/m.20867 type:complete len:644 (-) Transcript_9473:76-2007(-)
MPETSPVTELARRRLLERSVPHEFQEELAWLEENGAEDDESDVPLLHRAAASGRADLCVYLMLLKADLEGEDSKGLTAMDYASKRKTTLQRLQQCSTTEGLSTTLRRAFLEDQVPPIWEAALEIVEADGWDGVDLVGGKSLLHLAAENNRADVVEYCVMLKGDVTESDDQGRTPMDFALRRGFQAVREVIRYFYGGDEDPVDLVALPMELQRHQYVDSDDAAVWNTELSRVEKRGFNGCRWPAGFTLLHDGAVEDRLDICQYCVALKASLDIKDEHGMTPLQYAVKTEASRPVLAFLGGWRGPPVEIAKWQDHMGLSDSQAAMPVFATLHVTKETSRVPGWAHLVAENLSLATKQPQCRFSVVTVEGSLATIAVHPHPLSEDPESLVQKVQQIMAKPAEGSVLEHVTHFQVVQQPLAWNVLSNTQAAYENMKRAEADSLTHDIESAASTHDMILGNWTNERETLLGAAHDKQLEADALREQLRVLQDTAKYNREVTSCVNKLPAMRREAAQLRGRVADLPNLKEDVLRMRKVADSVHRLHDKSGELAELKKAALAGDRHRGAARALEAEASQLRRQLSELNGANERLSEQLGQVVQRIGQAETLNLDVARESRRQSPSRPAAAGSSDDVIMVDLQHEDASSYG